MNKIKILLADDHPVVRQGLAALIRLEPDLEIIEEAGNGRDAVALTRRTQPDVVIMDLSMPLLNGAEATRQIRQSVPSAKVLVLTSYGEDEVVERLLKAGASGYLTKETAAADLVHAIREVNNGKKFFSPEIARRLHRYGQGNGLGHSTALKDRTTAMDPGLTSRQVEVLQLIAEGFANKQIAAELGISIKTVEKHRQQLMEKLGHHETASLTRYAIENKFIVSKPDPNALS